MAKIPLDDSARLVPELRPGPTPSEDTVTVRCETRTQDKTEMVKSL